MKSLFAYVLTMLIAFSALAASERPNVVFIAIDDMNDWIGPMGDPQAKTPNMDRLAARGITFQNAHTCGIYCGPARSGIFSGRFASTTGCYENQVYFREHAEYRPLQKAFHDAGYATFATGKLYHHPAGYFDKRGWDLIRVRTDEQKTAGWPVDTWNYGNPPIPEPQLHSAYVRGGFGPNNNAGFLDGGPIPNDKEELLSDTMRANWTCDILKQKHDKPFFLAVGFYCPHFPNYAPQKYFDMYDRKSLKANPLKADDLDDIPEPIRTQMKNRMKIHDKLVEIDAVQETLHGYRAATSYVDANIGRILDALEASPYNDNTIIVLWSDHGYHFGEKGNYGKHTLWERTSKVPFIWSGPGLAKNVSVDTSVSLIDMFPTFVDLCGLEKDAGLEGTSLAATLKDPSQAKDRTIFLPHMKPGGYAMMNQDWRYIHYHNDTEELYNVREDKAEWYNLADKPEYASIKAQFKAQAPKTFATPGPNSNELKLVTNGEEFNWILKPPKKDKTK